MMTLEQRLQPYSELSRMDKPVGTWLVLFPALWGLTLAHQGIPPISDMLIFAVGAFLVRGAGCTVNDILDRDLDPHVARTKNRPLARRALSVQQAVAYLGGQLAAAALLLLWLPVEVFYMAVGAVVLLGVYPLMKRITYWPQIFLGLCMNYSLPMAYVSVHGTLSLEALVLYGGAVFWTLAYDTIYAHQDKEDDMLVGVKSSALSAWGNSKIFLGACYAVFALSLGYAMGPGYGAFLALIPGVFLVWQVYAVTLKDPQSCLRAFKMNIRIGLLVWAVMTVAIHL